MKMTRGTQWLLHARRFLFYVLLLWVIGALAFVSREYVYRADWTYGQRNSLTETSEVLLAGLDEPLRFTAYIPDDTALREKLRKLFSKYQHIHPDIRVEFVNPELEPQRAQQDGIQYTGQILVQLGSRSEVVESTSEQVIANALQRMSRGNKRLVIFLEGHDERDPLAEHSSGMSRLLTSLQRSGFLIQPHSLVRSQSIPENTRFLVIAAPRKALLDGEVELLLKYVKQGGNLLWLKDPGDPDSLFPLAEYLGIQFGAGTIVDANEQLHAMLGIDHPAVVPVVDYGRSPLGEKLTGSQSLFPFATRLARRPELAGQSSDWQIDEFLNTLPNSWLETAPINGEIAYAAEDGDELGPLVVGMAFTRPQSFTTEDADVAGGDLQQRIVVIGDSDFLLNASIGQGVNLDLASNIFNWLAADDNLLNVSAVSAPDLKLEMNQVLGLVLAAFFLMILPAGLVLTGVFIWWRRRRR